MNKLRRNYNSISYFSYELDVHPTDSKAMHSVTPASPLFLDLRAIISPQLSAV